ncbi:hypothetical protein ACWIUD_09110 [Helicobacter sp. 23-1044]
MKFAFVAPNFVNLKNRVNFKNFVNLKAKVAKNIPYNISLGDEILRKFGVRFCEIWS